MIFLELFFGFFCVGCFSFGGAYGAIPLIRDTVLQFGWLTDEQLTYMIAVSESTPGPITVNLATYVGSSQAGFWGAVLATFAVVLPAFVIILLIVSVFKALLKNRYFSAALDGLKPCIIGIVMATGGFLALSNCFPAIKQYSFAPDWRAIVLTVLLAAVLYGWKPLFKKKLSPILFIVISAVFGIVAYRI